MALPVVFFKENNAIKCYIWSSKSHQPLSHPKGHLINVFEKHFYLVLRYYPKYFQLNVKKNSHQTQNSVDPVYFHPI